MKKFLTLTVLLALAATACAPQYGPNRTAQSGVGGTGISKENIGMVAGALGGAFAAQGVGKGKGNTLAIAGGTILGGLLGSSIGASLDRADMAYANSSTQNGLEQTSDGVTSTWRNPNTGNAGTVTPVNTYKTSSGQYCREFTQTVMIGGRNESASGTACRQPDGTWRIVN
ncbi:MAG TPA: hypothetical protein DIV86_01185 [Alphaproteobacteria bacterium]|nr:hypothetical protein [Alphaproteobacteria bacterium]